MTEYVNLIVCVINTAVSVVPKEAPCFHSLHSSLGTLVAHLALVNTILQ
jgi:hypothetical protein